METLDDVSTTGWFSAEQVAAIFDFTVAWVEWARDEGLLVAKTRDDGRERFDPLAVEGLRRRLERVHERVNGLDPREAERVRHCLAQGARERMRALAEGRSYSTHPTIPPPPAGWMTRDRTAYDALVAHLRERAASEPTASRETAPPPRTAPRPELVPPPRRSDPPRDR